MCCTVLYCAVLCCTVPYCTCCTVCCTVLCAVLSYNILHCVLFCTILHLLHWVLYWTILHCTALLYKLCYVLYYTTFCCPVLCIALCSTVFEVNRNQVSFSVLEIAPHPTGPSAFQCVLRWLHSSPESGALQCAWCSFTAPLMSWHLVCLVCIYSSTVPQMPNDM